jgi:hypothetical protein
MYINCYFSSNWYHLCFSKCLVWQFYLQPWATDTYKEMLLASEKVTKRGHCLHGVIMSPYSSVTSLSTYWEIKILIISADTLHRVIRTNILHLDVTVKVSNISACGKANGYVAIRLHCFSTSCISLSVLLLWIQNYQFILSEVVLQWNLIMYSLFSVDWNIYQLSVQYGPLCYTSTLFHKTDLTSC